MSMLSLLVNLLKLATGLFNYIERNQLMNAGEARALQAQMEELNVRVTKAIEARDAVIRVSNNGGLRDDDGYRRD